MLNGLLKRQTARQTGIIMPTASCKYSITHLLTVSYVGLLGGIWQPNRTKAWIDLHRFSLIFHQVGQCGVNPLKGFAGPNSRTQVPGGKSRDANGSVPDVVFFGGVHDQKTLPALPRRNLLLAAAQAGRNRERPPHATPQDRSQMLPRFLAMTNDA